MCFTTNGDVFGGFFSVAVTEQDETFFDPNVFIFLFESHGRCETPQRFVVKEELRNDAGVTFFKDDSFGWLFKFRGGSGSLYLGNEKSCTFCVFLSHGFEGLGDTILTGEPNSGKFSCYRLDAIRFERRKHWI